jgi:hypothetical protein
MADVYFVGEIEYAAVEFDCVSITWAVVPGNVAWSLREGLVCGETQTGMQGVDGRSIFNHPIDVQFETLSSEGWPFFVCEVPMFAGLVSCVELTLCGSRRYGINLIPH